MNSERDLPLTVFKPHVQIYTIVDQGSDDYSLTGHGFLAIMSDQIENQTVHYLVVEDVRDPELLLKSRLQLHNSYQKQRGSVIVWNDVEQTAYPDLAISFQSVQQCDTYWRLICEKIGKNYLEISGWDPLQLPNENNLAYIFEKTKTSKDLVEYNLLNSSAFSNALFSVFKTFQARDDFMGMGMIGRIVKSIFNNLDYRMIQTLFNDPTFDLILQVHRFLQNIDFPKCWAAKVKIRSIIPLSEEVRNKINIIHRLSFYRQNILDLMKEINLEQMIVMTQLQFSKDIVSHLTKDNILEKIISATYQNTLNPTLDPNAKKDPMEQETLLSQSEEFKQLQFAQRKMDFILEALIMAKQIQDENAKTRFLQKVYKCGVIEMTAQYLEKGILRAIDFFVCLCQSSPAKFVEYLKVKYRQSPSDNLHIKLCRKFNMGNQRLQSSILQVIKYISESFKVKENLDFFNGTFFALVFGGCKEQKAVLAVLDEVQNNLQNIESFFGQAIKSKLFDKLTMFLRSQKQQKTTQLRAIKILKRVILENADSSWTFKKVFLNQINAEIIKSGFFEYCMLVLQKNIRFNNVISSSMLENIKIISQINRFTVFHGEIQKSHPSELSQNKFILKILSVKEEIAQNSQLEDQQPLSHKRQLQQQYEEAYFLSQMQEETVVAESRAEEMEQLENLRRMHREIQEQEKERQKDLFSQPSKKLKEAEIKQEPTMIIQLDLPFDEELEQPK